MLGRCSAPRWCTRDAPGSSAQTWECLVAIQVTALANDHVAAQDFRVKELQCVARRVARVFAVAFWLAKCTQEHGSAEDCIFDLVIPAYLTASVVSLSLQAKGYSFALTMH